MWQGNTPAYGFMPPASPRALASIGRTGGRWTLHHHSDKSLQKAETYNPYIQGWINYYGIFYRTKLRPIHRGSISMSSAGRGRNGCGMADNGHDRF
jgi:Group II intron, maturase-specific domain